MTISWSDWEFQEEAGLEFEYRRVSPLIRKVGNTSMGIKSSGYAEIKPHHLRGMRAGMCQLALNPDTGTRILITYLPVRNGHPVETGTPDGVRVLARKFVQFTNATVLENPNEWWDIGSVPPPKNVTLNDRQKFGLAIEEPVRQLFHAQVIKHPRTIRRSPSNYRTGPDVLWNELADFYAELGRELRDPLYTELALELSG